MALIQLPSASGAGFGGGGRSGVRLPTAADVPQVQGQRDPGVVVPAPVSSGLEFVAGALSNVGKALQQQQNEFDATTAAETQLTFEQDSTAEFQRLQTEDDPARPGFASDFTAFLEQQRAAVLGSLPDGMSEAAAAKLGLRLQRTSRRMTAAAGTLSINESALRADDAITALTNRSAAIVQQNPDMLDSTLESLDGELRDFAGSLTANAERDARASARAAIVESALTSAARQGRVEDVETRLASGDFDDVVSPAVRDKLVRLAEAQRNTQAKTEVTDAIAVLDRGRIPANLAVAEALSRGTDFAAPLQAAIEDRDTVEQFIVQSLPEQRSFIRGAPDTLSRRDVELLDRLSRLHAGFARGVSQGQGLTMAVDAGVMPAIEPLEIGNPAALEDRMTAALIASEWAGVPVSPLLPAEEEGIIKAFDDAPPAQVVALLQGLSAGFDDMTPALVAAIAPKRGELAVALTLSSDAPLLSRDIVLGARVLRDHPDVRPDKAARVDVVESVASDIFTAEASGALASFVTAAEALYAGRRFPGGDLTYDAEIFETALNDVMGGPVTFNGRTILPPRPFMDENAVEDLVSGLTDESLVNVGNGRPVFADGTAFTVELFDRGLFHTDAQLVTSGTGRYTIFLPGLGFVLSDQGGAYEIDLSRLAD